MVHFHSCILDTKVKSTDSEDDQLLAVSFSLSKYTGHLLFTILWLGSNITASVLISPVEGLPQHKRL